MPVGRHLDRAEHHALGGQLALPPAGQRRPAQPYADAVAVRAHSKKVVREGVKESHRALVLEVDPLKVEITGSGLIVLEEEDLMISQHLRKYHRDHKVVPGDTLAVIPVHGDEWVATDVISTKDTFEGADTESVAAGGRVFGAGTDFTSTTIIGLVPFRDENENIIGYLPLIA